eukprot:gene20356-23122_t
MECALDPCEFSPAYAALMVAQRSASTVDTAADVKVSSPVAVDTKGKSKLKSHHLIMDFPSVKLAALLVSQWLNIWDLGRLDSAVCNHSHQLRTKYLKMFGPTSMISMSSSGLGLNHFIKTSDPAALTPNSRLIHSAECFRFLHKRHIALTTLALTLFPDKHTLTEYLVQFGHKLLVLELCGHLNNLNSWQLYHEIFAHVPKLQVLLMHPNSSMICAQDVLDITQQCTFLKTLHLHNKFHLLPPKNLGKVYPKVQPNLAVHSAGGANIGSFLLRGYAKSTQFCLTSLSEQCARLHTLDLEGCVGLNDTALLKIANTCRITHYNLNHCTKLTAPGLLSFFTANTANNKHIKVLKCNKVEVSDDLLVYMAAQCAQLVVLSLKLSKAYTDIGLSAIAQQCVQLQKLFVQQNDTITDDAIQLLTEHGTNLNTLALNNCTKLTDATLSYVVTLPRLHTLHIAGRSGITETGLFQMLDNAVFAGNLTDIDVSDVPTFTDKSVRAIAQACVSLEVLNISGLSNVTDSGLYDIAMYCTKLHTLYMRELIYITDASIQLLVQKLGHVLHTLHIPDCAKLADDSVLAIAMHCNTRLTSLVVRGLEALTDMA